MDKKKYITLGVTIIFLFSLFIYFTVREEIDLDKEEVVSEERREELEEMKDKDFYKDPLLDHLGWTKKELIERHGEPDIVEPHYYGEEKIYYNNLRTGFILSREERVVNILYLYSEAQILGIKVGMNASEIESVLGEPRIKGEDYGGEVYIMTYFLGDQREDLAELELWVYMQDEEGPSERIKVFWKKYWE